jgi:alkylated DNA repair dioxygenase AlkB
MTTNENIKEDKNVIVERRFISYAEQPIPGLFLFPDFITEAQEEQILAELDGTSADHRSEFLPWKAANFNGPHFGKRWGVHCNIRDRKVEAPENPLPNFIRNMLAPKLELIAEMKGCVPNEANAIDYRRRMGHYLTSHVDDRKLSKEPIVNLSLAGDCYMTFTNVAPHRNTTVKSQKVLLKRRCLQILTGQARYDFAHGIERNDLLSDRRVSVTMRESPRTDGMPNPVLKIHRPMITTGIPSMNFTIEPSAEPIPGLFLFPNFITEEEETIILKELDDKTQLPPWSIVRHTGLHREKTWGIDHDLWSKELRKPKHELPSFMHDILIPRLKRLKPMKDCVPNEVNAIEYHRKLGHYLKAHADDRRKHKEPIANLSLAGDTFMVFQNMATHRNIAIAQQRVFLQRRTLQVMTGKARFEYSHAILNEDLLSNRRVSITMRETPFKGITST